MKKEINIFTLEKIKQIGENVLSYGNCFLLCSDYSRIPTSQTKSHTHDFYEIQYVFNGEGIEIIEGKSYSIHVGSMILLTPGIGHVYYSVNNLSIFNICFYPEEIQIQNFSHMANKVFKLSEKERIEFETTYFMLQNVLKNSKDTIRPQLCFHFLLEMINTFSLQIVSAEKQWSDLLFYIAQHYSTVKLNDAAKIFGTSAGFFSRSFKKRFGKTFVQYIDCIKIEKAKTILENPKINISEISNMVGFSHPTRFYKIFKKNAGMTPKEYRVMLLREKSEKE